LGHYSRLSTLCYLAAGYSNFSATGKVLSFPRRIQIQTSTTCNGRCVFCPYPKLSGTMAQGMMPESLFYKIVDELKTARYFSEVVFELHNEPLMDKRTFQFISYVKNHATNKVCTLVTNGQLIDNYTLSEIRSSQVDKFIISLNAFSPETYEKISGLDYRRIEKNIASILNAADLRKKLVLSFVVTEQTQDEIRQALPYWKKKGISTRVEKISNRAGALENFESLRIENNRMNYPLAASLRINTIARLRHLTGCYTPLLDMNVLFNGDVILCCNDWQRKMVIGNANLSSLKEIWNSPSINRIRELMIKKKYSDIPLCRNCSIVGR
jgi:radical SAM protein with 4Fe4S-binding SPASM domain